MPLHTQTRPLLALLTLALPAIALAAPDAVPGDKAAATPSAALTAKGTHAVSQAIDSLSYEEVREVRARIKDIGDYKTEKHKVSKSGKPRIETTATHTPKDSIPVLRVEQHREKADSRPDTVMLLNRTGLWFLIGKTAIRFPAGPELERTIAALRPSADDKITAPVNVIRPEEFSAIREQLDGKSVIRVRQAWNAEQHARLVQKAEELMQSLTGLDQEGLPSSVQEQARASLQTQVPTRSEELLDEQTGFMLMRKYYNAEGKLIRSLERRLIEAHQVYSEDLFTVPKDFTVFSPANATDFAEMLKDVTTQALKQAIKARRSGS